MTNTRRDVLNILNKRRLIDITQHFGYTGWSVLSKDEIVAKLSRKRSVSTEEILSFLRKK